MYSGLVGGLPFVARVALLAWRLLCVLLVVSCSSSCLLMHSYASRIFVTTSLEHVWDELDYSCRMHVRQAISKHVMQKGWDQPVTETEHLQHRLHS